MAAVPPVGSGPGCPYGLSPAGRSMVNCFEKTLLCFVSQNQMWFYHAQKALSMIFLKKNLKNQCTEYQPEYRCKILWCTVHYGSYCSADPCTAGDRPAERCRSCSNPPSRVRLKMPGKTKTSVISTLVLLVERSNPNPNHCPLGHLWRRFHRKWWFLCRLCSWM